MLEQQSSGSRTTGTGTTSSRTTADGLAVLTWNTHHADPERSERQAKWLAGSGADVLVLTEVDGGHDRLETALREEGFSLLTSAPAPYHRGEHLVLAARGHHLEPVDLPPPRYQPHRCVAARLIPPSAGTPLTLAGMYVPSRGGTSRRHNDKRAFKQAGSQWLPRLLATAGDELVVVAGDLNLLEPGEVRHYQDYGPWEYDFYWSFAKMGLADAYRVVHPEAIVPRRWFGRLSARGGRFEHLFVSRAHAGLVSACAYDEEPRDDALSEHAALWMCVDQPAPARRPRPNIHRGWMP
ncbi:endonuclease/exonuclease/phosphatase family protein [Kineosporia sp. J2-2]|uniref:Endonuclease/exonuclease/phosphatase family protein n=1 Tax=Kineosporia corallincola TaxID=2835133 RepID=A0ABS5TEL8_9ACTN|nr:endonuclease/exonuclease/phosphatase family protein [Kineosporia corallincola]MBT0769491.1 endonuclease/exonuclease/phosphatase family protein [Kineosporia corallincola]